MEVLLSPNAGRGPQGTLDDWILAYDLVNTTVIASTPDTNAQYGPREWGYVVDLCTMRIVWAEFGTFGFGTTTGEKGLAALTRCLSGGC